MNNKIKLALIAAATATACLTGCQDDWDDHYGQKADAPIFRVKGGKPGVGAVAGEIREVAACIFPGQLDLLVEQRMGFPEGDQPLHIVKELSDYPNRLCRKKLGCKVQSLLQKLHQRYTFPEPFNKKVDSLALTKMSTALSSWKNPIPPLKARLTTPIRLKTNRPGCQSV